MCTLRSILSVYCETETPKSESESECVAYMACPQSAVRDLVGVRRAQGYTVSAPRVYSWMSCVSGARADV